MHDGIKIVIAKIFRFSRTLFIELEKINRLDIVPMDFHMIVAVTSVLLVIQAERVTYFMQHGGHYRWRDLSVRRPFGNADPDDLRSMMVANIASSGPGNRVVLEDDKVGFPLVPNDRDPQVVRIAVPFVDRRHHPVLLSHGLGVTAFGD